MTTTTAAAAPVTAPSEPTTVEKLRGLPWSIFSNAANTVYAQFTFFGSVFVLFLSDLGMDKARIGFLLSLIPFAGLIALFIASPVARFGYKRTFITFFAIRKIITAGLLLTPWVLTSFGQNAMITYITLITAGFALSRAVAEVGVYPWLQEYIPNSVRGKYSATNSIYTTLVGLAAVAVAGYVLDRTSTSDASALGGYMALIAAGVIAGFISVWAASKIPGGAPRNIDEGSVWRGMLEAARDNNFLRYLAGAALITIGSVPMVSFLPLFMEEQIGLSPGNVVLLQSGTLIGNLVSSLPWGWASDRYGSKPVMVWGLALKILLPILWFMMPRTAPSNLYIALAIAVLLGVSDMAWGIGAGRLLFVSVVPPQKKTEYMALHYAWIGVIGGLSQLMGGWMLDLSAELDGQVAGWMIDPYTPLFVLGLALTLASLWLLLGMRADNIYGVGQFAGMFFRGNPFLAMGALVRYYMAKDERATVSMTEALGQAKSPLAVDELLETLQDPRFNVRYEAIVSIARMPPDPRLTGALLDVLDGTELALGTAAAWALGRIGDPRAIEPLREALDSNYHSIRAHAARALGALQDYESIALLLDRLESEQDKGLQMAYASALGNLGAVEAVSQLVSLLRTTQNPGARLELALSLARIVGEEHYFIQLLRQARTDLGTAAAQAIEAFTRKLEKGKLLDERIEQAWDSAALYMARNDLQNGAIHLAGCLRHLPGDLFTPPASTILAECAARLEESGAEHREYILLALHVLETAPLAQEQ